MLLACAAGTHAQAQTSATVALLSEYSARGVSLSSGRPSVQASVAYDAGAGWYAGAFASPVALHDSEATAQLIGYGGYAARLPSELGWEAGVQRTAFVNGAEYNYDEAYAGITTDRVGARIYLAPAYYGDGGRTAYAELNGAWPLAARWQLAAHLGVLHGLRGRVAQQRDRLDLRLALGADLGRFNLQVAWLATRDGAARGGIARPRALALSASASF